MNIWATRRAGRAWLAAVVAAVLSAGHAAAQSRPAGVEDLEPGTMPWFEAWFAWADTVELPEGVYLEYQIEHYPEGDEELLQELRRRTANRFDHPDRPRLAQLERRLEHGPDRTRFQVWWAGPERFRVHTRHSTLPDRYWTDVAVTGSSSGWQIRSARLELIDVLNDDILRTVHLAPRDRYQQLITGCLGAGPLQRQPTRVHRARDGWAADVSSADSARVYRYQGTLDVDTKFPLVTSMVVQRSTDAPELVGASIEFNDYRYSPVADRAIAHRVTTTRGSGDIDFVERVLEFRFLNAGEIDDALRVPEQGKKDLARGVVALEGTVDLRTTLATRLDSLVTNTAIPAPLASRKADATRGSLYWGAGLGFVTIALVLVVHRFRK